VRAARGGIVAALMREEAFRDGDQMLPLLTSAVIPAGFRHGFTTRAGGVSAGAFATLNLGGRWGDADDAVAENRRRVQRAAGGAIAIATQVHGADVVRVRPGGGLDAIARQTADGLCTDVAGAPVGVYVADCIPVLLADARTGAVAAVHAGWRGSVAGVVPAAVARMAAEFGTRAGDLRVALGPAIGPCCFEVGEEVVDAVAAVISDAVANGVVRRGGHKPHVDLKRLNGVLLERAGVPPAHVDAGPECTSCDRTRFFSYRRDGGSTGQMMGFIAGAAAPGAAAV
jgi:polyphenol oxidase